MCQDTDARPITPPVRTGDASGNKGNTAGSEAAAGALKADRFELLRVAVYHDEMMRWHSMLARWINLLTILLGTSAFAGFAGQRAEIAQVSALMVAVAGALGLVFDFGGRARVHLDMKRRACAALADLEKGNLSSAEVQAEIISMFADEPPEMRAVGALAHNQAGRTVFGDAFTKVRVRWLERRLRHIMAFRSREFPDVP